MGEEKIVIHVERNCAWCETADGTFVYGKDRAEVERALTARAKAFQGKGINS